MWCCRAALYASPCWLQSCRRCWVIAGLCLNRIIEGYEEAGAALLIVCASLDNFELRFGSWHTAMP